MDRYFDRGRGEVAVLLPDFLDDVADCHDDDREARRPIVSPTERIVGTANLMQAPQNKKSPAARGHRENIPIQNFLTR